MAIKKYFTTSQKFLKKSQQKLHEVRARIKELKKQEQPLAAKEDVPGDKERAEKAMVMNISLTSAMKATVGVLLVLGLAQVLGMIKSIIILFLVALFLSATLNRPVDWLEEHKIPRGLAVLIMYILLLGLLALVFSLLGPLIADQLVTLAGSINTIIQNALTGDTESWLAVKLQPFLEQLKEGLDQRELMGTLTESLRNLGSTLTQFAGRGLSAVFSIFNGILNFVLVLVITFFMTMRGHASGDFFRSLFPKRYSAYIREKFGEINVRIGEWVRGQFLLALTMGIVVYIAFSIIGVEYTLTIAMIAALAEFIPYLGPIITFAVAALISANQSMLTLMWVAIAYAIIQVLENNVLVPLIMGRTVGLSPVVILFSLLSGWTLGSEIGGSAGMGLVGMIFAVPIANIIAIFVEDYTEKNK